MGRLARATTPRMGNAVLAALRKKSRRDWSSSCFFFFSSFSIMVKRLEAETPKSAVKQNE